VPTTELGAEAEVPPTNAGTNVAAISSSPRRTADAQVEGPSLYERDRPREGKSVVHVCGSGMGRYLSGQRRGLLSTTD
jgi:hypothetical protein